MFEIDIELVTLDIDHFAIAELVVEYPLTAQKFRFLFRYPPSARKSA